MDDIARISIKNQKIIFFLGVSFPILYGISWAGVAGFFPPPSPNLSAEAIGDLYRDNSVRIRVGMMFCLLVNCLMIPWAITIASQMRRVEVGRPAMWSTFSLLNGIFNVVFFMMPTCLWMTTAFVADFRPDFSDEGLRVMNDFAWILWFTTYGVTTFQCWSLGYVGLQDDSKKPVFPRWWCYVQFWVGMAYFPAGVVGFFVLGPFTWVGVVGLYVPVVVYFLWFPTTAWGLWRSIKSQEDELIAGVSDKASAIASF